MPVSLKKECKSEKCGMWPWKGPKWPWFLAEVAVKPFRDLATLATTRRPVLYVAGKLDGQAAAMVIGQCPTT
jgi:hypothetical protein